MSKIILDTETEDTLEVNFDGLVGPTHNYAGLAFGNLASLKYAHQESHPKEAALQGLRKMHLLKQLGLMQAILPPHERPNLPLLRTLGFVGNDIQILTQAKKIAPELFYACYSSSSMWTANAGTVSSSRDSQDGKLHITPANLISHLHRSFEAEMSQKIFQRIFKDTEKFIVHSPLPSHLSFADEGAANHNRLCLKHGTRGLQIFVYGRNGFNLSQQKPQSLWYPARQTLEASQSIARQHRLRPDTFVFVKQNPHVIDKGVFHNDVISVMNQNVILSHELAFENSEKFFSTLQEKISYPIYFLKIKETELSIKMAVESYLFNSQLVTLPDQSMALIAPEECREITEANDVLHRIIEEENPIRQFHFVNCRESMKNGGGPACLRLRILLTEDERKASIPEIFLDENRYLQLADWIEKFYRHHITDADLLDPLLVEESQSALDALTKILNLGSLYSFQKA